MGIWDIAKIALGILVVSGTVFYFTKSVKRLFQVAGGLAIYETINNLYDIGLWPLIQGLFGGYGAVGLTILALILNFVMLKWCQRCKTDWLGITVMDDIVDRSKFTSATYKASHSWKKFWLALPTFGLWITTKAITIRIIPFVVLSVVLDSFVATAFYLHRKNGSVKVAMTKWDYVVFLISTIFSCIAWTFFTEFLTLPAFKSVWHTFAD